MPQVPPVHLVIRLPYNRADAPAIDPQPIEWNADKENMLWEVIARSRAADSGGTDWQGLSAHLQVPLPYLLYRAQVRYEEDLRGLQDIRGSLGAANSSTRHPDATRTDERTSSAHALPQRVASRLTSPVQRRTPICSQQHSNSQSNTSSRPRKPHESTSTLTLPNRRVTLADRDASPGSSRSSTSSDEIDKAEEEERRQEEQDAVGKRLKELEKLMSSDMLGFARPPREKSRTSSSTMGPRSPLRETVTAGDSVSDTASVSPQGSIPSIPSPAPETRSPSSSQGLPSTRATTGLNSPPLHSSRGRPQHQSRLGVAVHTLNSQRGSSHGSSGSSFSDISDAASVSASALESALLSNIRGGGSKLSIFARSHFGSRGGFGH